MKTKKPKYKIRKVAGRRVLLDPDIFYNPKILNSSLMIVGARRVIVCDYRNKKYFSLPRFILKAKKGQLVDHRNRNPLDNRRGNLRIATARQNALNRRLISSTTMIGVSKTKKKNKGYYEAHFRPEKGKMERFYAPLTRKGLKLAAQARDKFVLQAGDEEFAPLNFPIFKNEPFKSILLRSDLNECKVP